MWDMWWINWHWDAFVLYDSLFPYYWHPIKTPLCHLRCIILAVDSDVKQSARARANTRNCTMPFRRRLCLTSHLRNIAAECEPICFGTQQATVAQLSHDTRCSDRHVRWFSSAYPNKYRWNTLNVTVAFLTSRFIHRITTNVIALNKGIFNWTHT
jgi:hypothetical protein